MIVVKFYEQHFMDQTINNDVVGISDCRNLFSYTLRNRVPFCILSGNPNYLCWMEYLIVWD